MCAVLVAVCLLGACTSSKDSSKELPAAAESAEETEPDEKSAEEMEPAAGQEEKPGKDSEPEAEKPESSGETPETPGASGSQSGEAGEQTAVYTQSYSESGMYVEAVVHLYARGDRMYRLEEQLEFQFRAEELDLGLDPEDMEEMLDMMGEVFQELMDEYGEAEGVTTDFKRQDTRFFMTITCEITEETAQGIVDRGFLEVEEAEELLSFQKACEALEAQDYTRS